MPGDSRREVDGGNAGDVPQGTDSEQIKNKKNKKGVLSRLFSGIFKLHGNDFEKRLQYISKEEAAILSRMKRRSNRWRDAAKNLIVISLVLEVVAVGFAITTTRSLKLSWQMRATRVLPMFLLPVLAFLIYSALGRFTRMCDHRNENTLKKLRDERQAKLDELKERTNYYTTQQLIQKYDTDPAAKAAATSVLASKLGADSGMRVFLGEETVLSVSRGKSRDIELVQSGGLRNRKHMHARADSIDGTFIDHHDSDMLQSMELQRHEIQPTSDTPNYGSWISRLAALLVGEDPTQSYAVICKNCFMHNGLAKKEDFPYITYYCPHCKVLNKSKPQDELISGSSNLVSSSSSVAGLVGSLAYIDKDSKGSVADTISTGSPVAGVGEGITSVSSVIGGARSVADIDEDGKGSVVKTISTSSPVKAAGEGIPILSSERDAARSVSDIDKDIRNPLIDMILTSNPVPAAGEGITTLSTVTGAASSVTDRDKDREGLVG